MTHEMTRETVTSKDGTTVGYRRIGRGPAVILLHGAMETGLAHSELAEALARDFTCFLPDRRGRGISGPCGAPHGVRDEVEDLRAVLAATGAERVLGVSSGAIITLLAALETPALGKVAIFEPPFLADTAWLPRFERELAAGKVAAALVTSMLGTRMGPPALDRVPRPILRAMAAAGMNRGGELSFRSLVPTLSADTRIVLETRDGIERLGRLDAEVLLLGGETSAPYLRAGLDRLEEVLPKASRIEWPGLGHGATGNARMGGRPELVARDLRRFFLDQ
ncbi:alpha/beta fold hydrolase [Nonomuraea indica]|uniref:Alpha/beta fold hydrolase n=1 Tax=Nonomuraea indica TaxID=1581193 RepID=A0ABW8ADJ1_9ACTN